ncbi:MAG: type II secretion system protein GspG [Lysobacterales bacterium CG02_land_8_20_14_3_00_62_12]|nr:MAG: type II secretion system protein GspG [Xanthomonadales bacterium CG02_land_8_20_14_3_00_62_12]
MQATTGNPRHRPVLGFTLIEIVVAVAILAILSSIVAVKVIGNVETASVTKAKTDIQALSGALNIYKLQNFDYPSTDQGLRALVEKPGGQPEAANWQTGGYVERLSKDPWNRDYQYLSPGQHGEFDVYSLGKDGQLGGDGANADIGNW